MQTYDVIVVGLGAMGTSACFHLARRGAKVLGLEKYDIPHANGSSHGFSRMTRMAYYEHPDYVPLLKSAFSLWHDLEAQCGQKLIYVTGGLFMGPPDGEVIRGALLSAQQHNLPHEMLDRAALHARYPQFHIPDHFVGMLERNAGFILPEKSISAHARLALESGAELHGQEPVLDWSTDDHGVTVTTPRGTYHARQILFSGGAWTDKLVRDLGIPLRVTRQALAWVWPKKAEAFQLGQLPVWAIDHLDGTIHYGFPMHSDSPGFKLAHHGPASPVNPDTVNRQATDEDEQTIRPLLKDAIPDADGPLLSMRICLYTNSPDSHFIIDRHPRHPRVLLACGFSGHGFKFATVIGRALSDLLVDGKTDHPVDFLGLSRFVNSK